jgi:hypothetical protein
MEHWLLFLLLTVAALLFRGSGDSWPVTVAKLALLVVLVLVAVAVLGGVRLRFW